VTGRRKEGRAESGGPHGRLLHVGQGPGRGGAFRVGHPQVHEPLLQVHPLHGRRGRSDGPALLEEDRPGKGES